MFRDTLKAGHAPDSPLGAAGCDRPAPPAAVGIELDADVIAEADRALRAQAPGIGLAAIEAKVALRHRKRAVENGPVRRGKDDVADVETDHRKGTRQKAAMQRLEHHGFGKGRAGGVGNQAGHARLARRGRGVERVTRLGKAGMAKRRLRCDDHDRPEFRHLAKGRGQGFGEGGPFRRIAAVEDQRRIGTLSRGMVAQPFGSGLGAFGVTQSQKDAGLGKERTLVAGGHETARVSAKRQVHWGVGRQSGGKAVPPRDPGEGPGHVLPVDCQVTWRFAAEVEHCAVRPFGLHGHEAHRSRGLAGSELLPGQLACQHLYGRFSRHLSVIHPTLARSCAHVVRDYWRGDSKMSKPPGINPVYIAR